MQPRNDQFTKPQIACIAVFLLQGHNQYIHTEDVAIACNDLAPGRFQWQRHPDQVSLDKVRHALNDAKKAEYGQLMMGSNREGWMLTEAGMAYAATNADAAKAADLQGSALPPKDAARQNRERERLLATSAYKKRIAGDPALTRQDAESFFRVDDYVFGAARERRIVRILNTVSDDPELKGIAHQLAQILRQEGVLK